MLFNTDENSLKFADYFYYHSDYLKMKIPILKEEYEKLSDEMKQYAFTVAGVTKTETLKEIQELVVKAKESGTGYEDFKRQMKEKGLKLNPLVYYQNVFNAEGAGEYAQLKEITELYPYWQYWSMEDDRVRKSHAAMHGKVFRHNDPIWDIWFPPNGFNCRCGIKAINGLSLKKKGLKVEKGSAYANLKPDKGFEGNPGKALDYWIEKKKNPLEKEPETVNIIKEKPFNAGRIESDFLKSLEVYPEEVRKLILESFKDSPANIKSALSEMFKDLKIVFNDKMTVEAYFMSSKNIIEMGRKVRDQETLRHETGHALDYFKKRPSMQNTEFQEAFEKDKKRFRKREEKIRIISEISKDEFFIKDGDLQDAFCSLTKRAILTQIGHEASYYKKNPGADRREVWADLFNIYHRKGSSWDYLKKEMPNLTAVFEKIIKEI